MNSSKKSTFPFILLGVCTILWFFAPFMAVNYASVRNQPTAFQVIIGDVWAIGSITVDNPAFYSALVSVIGICLSILFILKNKPKALRITAIIANVVLIIAAYDMMGWSLFRHLSLFDVIGIGYTGIFILNCILAICVMRKKGDDGKCENKGSFVCGKRHFVENSNVSHGKVDAENISGNAFIVECLCRYGGSSRSIR